ncbi:MAG TPA: methyltransferase domain-containing protein [Candidatus Brocadiia bacterium]|nr:methyltransferase domain-containing protein [Candidatus Brocadiia bacterium]
MFDLTERDLSMRIVSCADGPAAFNAGMRGMGRRVISTDPIYIFNQETIRRRIEETRDDLAAQVRNNTDLYVWREIPTPDDLIRKRMEAMTEFLKDYAESRDEGRYVAAALPNLPFADASFDIALCSHFLFTYSDRLDAGFHIESVIEMCRVAREARIFPLLDADSMPSERVGEVTSELGKKGFEVRIAIVPYEFQVEGNRMMVVSSG